MLTSNEISEQKLVFTKDLVTDQTFVGLTVKANTSGRTFTTDGLGTSTATSTIVFPHIGGFDDQRVVGTCKYVAPTISGDEEIGVMARVQTLDDSADEDYYYARVDGGLARLTKVIGGVFTTLSSSAFPLAQGDEVTITLEVVGSALSATFDAGGSPATVTLGAVDTDIPSGGLTGFRTRSSTGFFSSIEVREL